VILLNKVIQILILTDDVDDSPETRHHLGSADDLRAVPGQVTRIARPRADTDDHDGLRSQVM
jgi:hypothetical protein